MTPASKTALVTGGGVRIGKAISLGLAQAGWDIAVHYRHAEAEAHDTMRAIQAMGRRAITLQGDLADEKTALSLIERATTDLGSLSCLVNNAALFEFDDVESFSTQLLDRHMHINLAAPVIMARALHQITPARHQSVVINLLDQKLFNLNPSYLSYTFSKAALQTATILLAKELSPRVRVVGVAPGLTMIAPGQTEAEFTLAHRITPLERSSTPEDIAAAVVYLASASAVTGTTLVVDGGQHLLPLEQDIVFLTKMRS